MYAVSVTLQIKPGLMGAFLPAMLANARTSLECEVGCLQFDVCTVDAEPDSIVLYELYAEEADFAQHLKTEHFLNFDAESADMIASKVVRTGPRLFPEAT